MRIRFVASALSLALVAGCQGAPAVTVGASTAQPEAAVAALPAETLISGRAMVGAVPLANAEIVVFDPIANAPPLAPGAGDGVRLEARPLSVRTDAEGRFTIPLTLRAGQAAEVYVSDGAQSVCGVLVGPAFAVRNAGKTAIDAAHPLLLDMESTTTAGVMLGSLKALGKAVAKRRALGPDALLALQAKALDTMAAVVGETAAKLAALAGTADVAQKIAKHMVQADPRVPAPASRRVLDVLDDANPVLNAVVTALEETGATTRNEIRDTLTQGELTLREAERAAFADDAALAADLAAAPDAPTETPQETAPDGVPAPDNDSGSSGGNGDVTVPVSVTAGGPVQDPLDADVQVASSLVVTAPISLGDLTAPGWVDTGVVLSQGQEFRIQGTASYDDGVQVHDEVYFDGGYGDSGGYMPLHGNALETLWADTWVTHDASLGNYGALIGRIGNGVPFKVDAERHFGPAKSAGPLYVTLNNAHSPNTRGTVSVTVSTR
jgi:hypothetical protein